MTSQSICVIYNNNMNEIAIITNNYLFRLIDK